MNLTRMLERCRTQQWHVGDLDWSQEPPALSEADEANVVQFFTDMAGIERLAGALFNAQKNNTDDPELREIFGWFVIDELRHSHAAQMLADHYDVRKLRNYQLNPALVRFTPHFVRLIRLLPPDIANTYITTGELILDIALLRSIDDFVDDGPNADAMSHQAMELINRDESRHIAVDFHMIDHYTTPEYDRRLAAQPPPPLRLRARRAWTMANVLWHAAPFFREVFFKTMDVTDPQGRRMLEAFKRIQLVAQKRRVARRPFVAFMLRLQALHNSALLGPLVGGLISRVMGIDPRYITVLYSEAESRQAGRMSLDELADDALKAKYAF